MSLLLTNAHLLAPEPLGPGSVLVDEGRIAAVYRIGDRRPDGPALDLGGATLGPGWIDLHTHGAIEVELMDGDRAVQTMAEFYVEHGVTGFLPATLTASWEDIERAIEGARQAMGSLGRGARVLGVHLEGPFLSPERLGAQSPEHCIAPAPENVARLLEVAGDVARLVTMAPEEPGALELIAALVARGIVVSLGHSVATDAQARDAFEAGACHVTHLFNGMPPMHHRKPGLVGAALTAPGVLVELIADGLHLAPTTVRLALAAKGIDQVVLVTDSMSATGCPDGQYMLGPMEVTVHEGEARLGSGNLAGSTLTMERAVTNVARWTEAGLHGAWQMASLNPARQIGIDDHAGRIAPGYQADLTALDADGEVSMTMVDGEVVYLNRRVP